MAVGVCSHCGHDYWRYGPSTVPARYCSIPCWEARKKPAPPSDIDPHLMLAEIRAYLARWHQSAEWLTDEACCEALQRRYAGALYESV